MWANMMNGQGWGGMGIGMISVAAFWILLIALIDVLVGRALGVGARPEKTALDILRECYAAGEIERDEYEQKKRNLGG